MVIELADGDGDQPNTDDKGNILSIEHDDGSVTISIDGSPVQTADQPEDDNDWFANLASRIERQELGRIADDLLRGIDDDDRSRTEWLSAREQGINLLGLKIELPGVSGAGEGAPVEGMSKVRHPLLLEAVLRFQANARSELLPTDGPVKIRNDDNNADFAEDQLADALEKDINHYLTAVATEYYPDTDRMLLMTGFGGDGFKKVYYCPLRNRPVSESVDAKDFIVNNAATDLKNARRATHRMLMRPSIVKRMQILGVYRDIELSTPIAPKLNAVDRAEKEQQGISPESTNPEDRDREIYECYCELAIKGLEHRFKGKETGLEIPYRVTIDVSSREILSIVRNYDEETAELPEPRQVFVKYPFVPGLGFYDIGLLHILGNTTNAVTAAWREMLDNGMFANFPGFLMAQSAARQKTNIIRVPPGGGQAIDTQGMPIREAVMPLPYETAQMPALMSLVEGMEQAGQRLGGTAEQMVGEGRADVPVGTTLALIEQAAKVLNAVHKRLHAAQSQEFALLMACFREHPESFLMTSGRSARSGRSRLKWDEATFLHALENYELVPQADPNTASHTQRLMKVGALVEAAQANPQMFNLPRVQEAALTAFGWANPKQFINPNPQPDPKQIEAQSKAKVDQQEADAKTMDAHTDAAEVQAKAAQGAFAPKPGLGAAQGPQPPDPVEVEKLKLKERELDQDREATFLEAQNRERDRESKERLEAMTFVMDMAAHPEEQRTASDLMEPGLLHRLETNETPVEGDEGDH